MLPNSLRLSQTLPNATNSPIRFKAHLNSPKLSQSILNAPTRSLKYPNSPKCLPNLIDALRFSQRLLTVPDTIFQNIPKHSHILFFPNTPKLSQKLQNSHILSQVLPNQTLPNAPKRSPMFQSALKRFSTNSPKFSLTLQNTFFRMLQEYPKLSQTLQNAPKFSQPISNSPKCSQTFPNAIFHKRSQSFLSVPKPSQTLPNFTKRSQMFHGRT